MSFSSNIKQAMVMAAGLGTRLRPLTLDIPKPLLSISDDGMCCLGRVLDHLHAHSFDRIVVNTFYLPKVIQSFVNTHYPRVILSHETEPLETGGGILYALPHFDNDQPIVIVNGDTYVETKENSDFLIDLLNDFNPETDDILLGVSPKENGIGFIGAGDYDLAGRVLNYRPNGISAPYVFMGYRVLMPSFMRHFGASRGDSKGKSFSLKECFDAAESCKRLNGRLFKGEWCDLSTVDTLNALRVYLAANL